MENNTEFTYEDLVINYKNSIKFLEESEEYVTDNIFYQCYLLTFDKSLSKKFSKLSSSDYFMINDMLASIKDIKSIYNESVLSNSYKKPLLKLMEGLENMIKFYPWIFESLLDTKKLADLKRNLTKLVKEKQSEVEEGIKVQLLESDWRD